MVIRKAQLHDMSKMNTLIEKVEITDITEDGAGVGKANGLVLFVDQAVPHDIVDVTIYRKKKNFAHGKISVLHKSSPIRAKPFCKHFGICGGCKWQHITYEGQLALKQKSVCEALERIGKIDASICETILPSANRRSYRNKLEYTFSHKAWVTNPMLIEKDKSIPALGFHIPGRFDKILNIEECFLQSNPSEGDNEIRNALRTFALEQNYLFYNTRNHTGELRNLIIRTSSLGEMMVAVVFAYAEHKRIIALMDFLKNRFPHITSLLYIVNQKKNDTLFDQDIHVHSGRDHIFESMPRYKNTSLSPLKYKVGLKSFYQTNSKQAHELYNIAAEFADFQGNELVYDLYTGAGTIANFVANHVKCVIGIDSVESAIKDAILNSKANHIQNTLFYAGDMKDVLNTRFVSEHGKPDVIIADPPRAGMHPDVIRCLLDIGAAKIIYVSCNAATQARDIGLLTPKYTIHRIKPVDMFPHTQHVENVVSLALKPNEKDCLKI